MSECDGKCDRCRRQVFMSERKATWAHIYDFVAMEPSHTEYRCSRCTRKVGRVYSNARPANGNMSPYQGTIA